jgi:TolB protein
MRKIINLVLFLFTITLSYSVHAILSMELTRGIAGAIPISIVPFAVQGEAPPPQDVSGIITNDLSNSGRFKVYGRGKLSQFPSSITEVSIDYFRRLGTDNVVVGKVDSLGENRYRVNFQLLDMIGGIDKARVVLQKTYEIAGNEMRKLSHHISDLIYGIITGNRGVFSTRIAYVLVQRIPNAATHYLLEVSDQDGYNPRLLLNSTEPLMSPSWSPDGKQIAYVSFEKEHASIYLHDVVTGTRHLLSEFPGINGAPAWSPDGRKLALVLSKSGSPNIYTVNIDGSGLAQVTHDFYINTEPAWSPDGKSLLFTSNRSGGPQIYQVNLTNGKTSRVSFEGDYNARASYTRDGKYVAMIHKVSGLYNIAMLNLDTGRLHVLNSKVKDSSSPSLAPNGSMILYDTINSGHNELAMVSSDGRIQLRLPARNGEAQDPSWSP